MISEKKTSKGREQARRVRRGPERRTSGTRPANARAPREERTTDGRPEVVVGETEHVVTDAVIGHLAARMPELYVRDGALVRVVERDGPSGLPEVRTVGVEVLNSPALRDGLSRHVRLTKRKPGGTETVTVRPEGWLMTAVLNRPAYPGVRELTGLAEHPVMRTDGSLVTTPGHDPATGLFLARSGGGVALPEAITQEEARLAAEKLLGLAGDFPFADEASRSAWLAALLTPVVRPMLTGPTPFFLVTANVRGAGKGRLLDVAAVILTGRPMPQIAGPANDAGGAAEFRKRVTALLRAGETLVSLDNLTGEFGSPTIDQLLTTTVWRDRLLGGNQMSSRRQSITFFGTGNNVTVVADTGRRTCHGRLDSPLERPEDRDDCREKDILGHVRRHRLEYLRAALVILRGYVLAGRPDMGLPPWGSFEDWSSIVRSALVWAGRTDPKEACLSSKERADPVAESLRLVMDALDSSFDRDRLGLTAAEMLDHARGAADAGAASGLLHGIEELAGKLNAKSWGKALGKHEGRIVEGRRLVKMPQSKGLCRWRVNGSPAAGDKHRPMIGDTAAARPPLLRQFVRDDGRSFHAATG